MRPNETELPSEGHIIIAADGQAAHAAARQAYGDVVGHFDDVEGLTTTVRPSPANREGGPSACAADAASLFLPVPRETLCVQIRYWHRRRCFAMEQRKRADLALGSFLRVQLGWSLSLPAADRERIKEQAAALIALGEREAKAVAKGKQPGPVDEPAYLEWRDVILAAIQSRQPFSDIEARSLKEMERLAKSLPAWAWGEAVRGFGAASLAVIVGEAGDLSAYASHSKLWKRMGLAVIGGTRQGGLLKTASKEAWIAHGYSRVRRSRMWNIGACLVKSGEHYRQVYLHRKDYERANAEAAGLIVAPAAKIPAKRQAEFMSDGHIHRRAQRYTEKRLLRDLWRAWRAANAVVPHPDEANERVPPAPNSPAGSQLSDANPGHQAAAPAPAKPKRQRKKAA